MSRRKHAIGAYFQSGVRLRGAGRLRKAEQIYRQVLATAPNHAENWHMPGVIAPQSGHPQTAVDCIARATGAVSRGLWDLDDRISEKEARHSFDADFIALPRAVYRTNDERARIKREINLLLRSSIIGEKQYVRY